MTNWPNLTADERAAARAGRDSYTLKEKMNNCLYDALALLKGNDAAREIAWKLPWGNYLVNTAEEGYNEVFDGQQYNVKDKDGNEIPT